MLQFLYRIQPVRPELLTEGPIENEEQIVSDHFSYLKSLLENGIVILAGRTQNTESSGFGIVVFNAESEKEARQILHDDPGIKNRVFRGELFPFRIALLKAENAPYGLDPISSKNTFKLAYPVSRVGNSINL